MGKANLSKFINALIDVATKLGVKLTLSSTEVAKWANSNPEIAAALAKAGMSIFNTAKTANWSGIIQTAASLHADGYSWKQIIAGIGKGAFKGSGGAKALGVGAAKVLAVFAAAAFAKCTVKEAAKAWDIKTEKIKEGWKSGNAGKVVQGLWELSWETSIPVATYRQFESFFKSFGKKKKKQPDPEAEKRVAANIRARSNPMTNQGYSVQEYEHEAEDYEMGPAPTNPAAYNAWKKEVEMRRQHKDVYSKKSTGSKVNDIAWYNQGDASKISAGTLTWSDVKTNDYKFKYPFVAASAVNVAILMPMEKLGTYSYIHSRIKQNINVLFQALRGKNTGAFNYEEGDVFNYVYCLSTLIARIRYLQKVLRLANTHDVLVDNLHIALTDLAINPSVTSKYTYDDIVKNAPQYISRLNSLVEEINTYALPANTLISRWNYIADKGFKDYNGKQAVYCFYKVAVWPKFRVNAVPMTQTKLEDFSGTTIFGQLLSDLEVDVHAFRTLGTVAAPGTASNVMVKISGDMIKLLGANASTFANVNYYTGNPSQSFDYDVEAIDQLRNAKIFTPSQSLLYAGYSGNYQIIGKVQTVQTGQYMTDMVANDPTFQDGYLITTERNMTASGPENVQLLQFFWNARLEADADDTTIGNITMEDCSATFITRITSLYYTPNARTFTAIDNYQWLPLGTTARLKVTSIYSGSAISLSNAIERMCINAQLDYVPQPVLLTDSSGAHPQSQAIDVDNFAHITKDQYKLFNNVAAYSLTYYWHPDQLNINGII